jgi:hypothetical protein
MQPIHFFRTVPGMRARLLAARIGLAYLAVNAALLGLWASLAPKSWFENFPGAGHNWIVVDGPYNHHLAGDVGGLFLALAVVTTWAAVSLSTPLVRAAAAAWVVSTVPHVLYHLGHRAGLSSTDFVGVIGGLAFYVVVAVAVWVLAEPKMNHRVPTTSASQPSASSREFSSSGS